MFKDWLMKEKGYTSKVSSDILSRVKRAKTLLNCEELSFDSINELKNLDELKSKSYSVKSQIKKAILLYCEYKDSHKLQ